MNLNDFEGFLKDSEAQIELPGSWIAGTWVTSPKSRNVGQIINPSRGIVLAEHFVDNNISGPALDAAAKAERTIASVDFGERLEWLHQFRNLLSDYQALAVRVMRTESGKPKEDADAELAAALRHLDYIANNKEKLLEELLAPAKQNSFSADYTLQPVGTTVGYIPFSTPLASTVHCLAACFVAGCPLVLISPVQATLCSTLVALLLEQLELPVGAVSVVNGDYGVLKQTLSDKRIRAIMFTGSREHCETIRRESKTFATRELILQSGGKNAVLVHPSADLDKAADIIMQGAFKSAGQLCTSTSRVFVPQALMQEFEEKMEARFQQLKIGPTDVWESPADDIDLGPLYAKKAVDKFLRFQTMAHREASRNISFGKTFECDAPGYFVLPGIHIMREFDPRSAYQANVLFCPDVCIYEYTDIDSAIAQVNTTDAPLAASIVCSDAIDQNMLAQIRVPNVLINLPTVESEVTWPLAGRKESGRHRFSSVSVALLLTYPQAILKAE